MAIYQQIIRSDYNAVSSQAMESWMSNCIAFINSSTGLTLSYTLGAQTAGNTGFIVTVPFTGSHLTQIGIIMSAVTTSSSYFSSIIYDSRIYPLNSYGNYFDASAYYETKVVILHTADILRVLVALPDGEFHTMILLNRVTETVTGNKYWGCLGFIATSPTVYIIENLSQSRNEATAAGAISGDIRLMKAQTAGGRFTVDNLYSYFLPAVTELPEFLPFDVAFENGSEKQAVILGSDVIKNPSGTPFGAGAYISFTS